MNTIVEYLSERRGGGKQITSFVILPDFDVNFASLQVDEGQFGHVLPNLESFGKFAIHVGSLKSRRVFRNAVRQLFYTPTAPCVNAKQVI